MRWDEAEDEQNIEANSFFSQAYIKGERCNPFKNQQ